MGISDPLLASVTKQLDAKMQEIVLPLTADKVALFYHTAPKAIDEFLQAQGYFKAQVKTQLTHTGDKWNATYQINCGPLLRITQLDLKVSGSKDNAALQQVLRSFPLKVGDVFRVETYSAAKQFLFNCAPQFGYLAAILVKKQVAIDLEKYTAHIVLEFDFGPRYKFGAINFSPTPFSQSFLQRFLSFRPGEWYSSGKVKNLQEAFNNSNFFAEVTVTPDVTHSTKNKEVPISANLTPRKARQYNFGVGFGTDTGVRGLLGLELRHITANGQSFKGFAKLSEVQSSFETHYLIPGKNPINEQYDLSAALETQNQNYGQSNTLKVAGGYITTWRNWQETFKFSFIKENYNLTNQPIYHANLLVPSINILRSTTDNPVNPSQGYSLNFSAQGASKTLLSTTEFLQAQGNIKYLASLLSSDNLLVVRGTIGVTAINDLDKLPLSFQYFAGGTQSVRGYNYKSLGPGRHLVVGSVELRRKIFGDWYGTIFIDAGNASERFFPELKKGAGIGVLCNSPIGPVQISWAKALDLPGTPSRVQFNIGPEF